MPGNDCSEASASSLRALSRRLAASRVLMEHQLWEAARLLDEAGLLATDLRHEPGFRHVMEARRFGAAVTMLAEGCGLAQQTKIQPAGTATNRPDTGGKAMHRDPQTAALLRLLRAADPNGSACNQDTLEADHGRSD